MTKKKDWGYQEKAMESCIVVYLSELIKNMEKEGRHFAHLVSGSPHRTSGHIPFPGTNVGLPFTFTIEYHCIETIENIEKEQKKKFPNQSIKEISVKTGDKDV